MEPVRPTESIAELEELPQGLCGSARGRGALATVDRRYNSSALIVADLSNDPSYAEVLLNTFGPRVIASDQPRWRRNNACPDCTTISAYPAPCWRGLDRPWACHTPAAPAHASKKHLALLYMTNARLPWRAAPPRG